MPLEAYIYGGLYLIGLPSILLIINIIHKKLVVQRAIERKEKGLLKMGEKVPNPFLRELNSRVSFILSDKGNVVLFQSRDKSDLRNLSFKEREKEEARIAKENEEMRQADLDGNIEEYLAKKEKEEDKKSKPVILPIKRFMVPLFGWVIGLIISIVAGFTGGFTMFLVSAIIYWITLSWTSSMAKGPMERRMTLMSKMAEIAAINMGHDKQRAIERPNEIVDVRKWADPLQPVEIVIPIPSTFKSDAEGNFLLGWNQFFGTSYTWVTKGKKGWDYENSRLRLWAVPPLPKKAPMMPHYILSQDIAPTFFAIAIGSENGVQLRNPETGKDENVLGFDVQGKQTEYPYKRKGGPEIGPEIVKSPQGMIGGSTGGGKALDKETRVRVIRFKDKVESPSI